MPGVVTSPKTKLFIAGVHADATDTASEYAALTWVEVGEITNFGEFGTSYQPITHNPVGSNETYKFKGSKDNGSLQLTIARVPSDAGQTIIKTAADSYSNYDFKIELNDKPSSGVSPKPTTFYFPGKVMSYTTNIGGANNIVGSTVNIGIDGAIIEVAATSS